MPRRDTPTFDVGHPAPDRRQVGLLSVAAGLAGGPAAWTVQLSVLSALGALGCGPAADPARLVMVAVNLGAIAVAAAALALSAHAFRRTSGGPPVHGAGGVMDAGEGRSRFLSVWGLWTGVLFLVAIVFNTAAVFWSGLCAA